jgi:hypothetical protein
MSFWLALRRAFTARSISASSACSSSSVGFSMPQLWSVAFAMYCWRLASRFSLDSPSFRARPLWSVVSRAISAWRCYDVRVAVSLESSATVPHREQT